MKATCVKCKGTGLVRYRDVHPISSDIYPCQVCKGTGVVVVDLLSVDELGAAITEEEKK